MTTFNIGKEVIYTRTLDKNSRSAEPTKKTGTLIAIVRHDNRYTGEPMALVKFPHNRNNSRVPLRKLSLAEVIA